MPKQFILKFGYGDGDYFGTTENEALADRWRLGGVGSTTLLTLVTDAQIADRLSIYMVCGSIMQCNGSENPGHTIYYTGFYTTRDEALAAVASLGVPAVVNDVLKYSYRFGGYIGNISFSFHIEARSSVPRYYSRDKGYTIGTMYTDCKQLLLPRH